jgi:hypothetical protein
MTDSEPSLVEDTEDPQKRGRPPGSRVKPIAEGGRSASAYRQARLDDVEFPPRRKFLRRDASPRPKSRRRKQKRSGRKIGRPRNPALELRFKPTLEQRSIVQLLAGYAIPQERICKAIRNWRTRRPIDVSTLNKHFEAELEAGRAEVDQMLAHGLSKRLREANMTALIWVSKNVWGWADRVEQDGKSAVDLSIQIKPDDLPRLLKEHDLPPCLLGRDVPAIDEPVLIGNGRDRDVDRHGDENVTHGAGSDP